MPQVIEKIDDAILLVVGDGPEKDSLEKLVRDLEIEKKLFLQVKLIMQKFKIIIELLIYL